ncbi:hypothetical protein OIU84_006742 [Salix udensis]|uniref:CW-type domain-containing protein n=1 Tax=Salix udensis TaxID=889485 RepID=A0AAD6JZ23_9ROSI|nr:hypothetical protein OIU84_006742 [Salix udensis]
MGETEIEEGEACDYMDNSDQNFDIDVALSYLVRVSDDRIQDILGQYQKDFEGGVSAETLGPRFGGYGSFLPTYQRSPSKRSNPATQRKVQSHGMLPPSHDDRLAEGASRKSTSSLHETISARPTAALRSSSPLPLARPLPEDRLVKIQSSREHVSGYEPLQLPVNQSDQKMLKLRIKVGSDNCLPEQKISEIYSNLGLDMSPSLSSEYTDSPSEWERDFPDSLEEQMDSPTCIVRIMTSSIQSGAMLSPLHDCWLHLSEQKDSSDHERTIPVKECSVVWADEKVPVKKQKKPKNESSMDTSNRNHLLSDARNHPPESKMTKMGEVAAGTAGASNNSMRINLSAEPKEKTFQKSSPPCRSKGDIALLENLSKVKVKHPVSIGDSKAGRSKSRNHLLGTSVGDETVDCISGVHEKKTLAFRNKSKVSSVDKKPSLVSTSKANLRGDINGGAPAGLLPMEVAPYLIEENWVCCDKCHKWRLLPYGTNPDQLPQKWLCTMLDWLPGMNRCAISEEETTDTQRARCRLSVVGNHDGRTSHSVSTESSITFVNTWHDLDQNPQDLSFSGGKKKHEIKVVSNPAQCSLPKKLLNSTRKNGHVSTEKRVQNRSLPSWEKKLQKRLGDVQPQKSKTKREADQESFKLSKKARTDSMHFAEEDHNTGGFSKKKMGTTVVTEDQDTMGMERKKRKSKDWMDSQIYIGNHSVAKQNPKQLGKDDGRNGLQDVSGNALTLG